VKSDSSERVRNSAASAASAAPATSAAWSPRGAISWLLLIAGLVAMVAAVAAAGWVRLPPAAASSWDTPATTPFRTSELTLHPVELWPLTPDAAIPAPDSPIPMFDHQGRTWDHPSGHAQSGIVMLSIYDLDHDPPYLAAAERIADHMLGYAVTSHGATFLPYTFSWGPSEPPWFSGLAQGKALGLFSRLYERTGDERWRQAADSSFAAFLEPPGDDPWVSFVDERGNLWLEEYPGDPTPNQVLNGHIAGAYGLYEYVRVFGPVAEASRLLDGALTTVIERAPDFRVVAGISYYGLRYAVQHPRYHLAHIGQIGVLADMTGSPGLDRLEQAFTWDEEWWRYRGNVAVVLAVSGLLLLGAGLLLRFARMRGEGSTLPARAISWLGRHRMHRAGT
jgi:hypothetical protein